jgi:hypothetical protein
MELRASSLRILGVSCQGFVTFPCHSLPPILALLASSGTDGENGANGSCLISDKQICEISATAHRIGKKI